MINPVDIVIPVWNRPVETRACLAALVENSPEARLIMVNYGSERETERILDEFADALDDRAMLVSTERNVGRVAALNHGIRLSSAPLVVIVQDDVTVRGNWLDVLVETMTSHQDIGLAIPSAGAGKHRPSSGTAQFCEVDHGSLGVMMLRRGLYEAIGGLDEHMDGGLWCLRDYSRRAERAGFRTVRVTGCALAYGEPQQLGSIPRREERIRNGELMYRQRWGGQHHFCFGLAGPEAESALEELVPGLRAAARQGNIITILADRGIARKFSDNGYPLRHANISVETLPPLFTGRAMKKKLASLAGASPDMVSVVIARDVDTDPSCTSLHSFLGMIDECRRAYYAEKGATDAVNSRCDQIATCGAEISP